MVTVGDAQARFIRPNERLKGRAGQYRLLVAEQGAAGEGADGKVYSRKGLY